MYFKYFFAWVSKINPIYNSDTSVTGESTNTGTIEVFLDNEPLASNPVNSNQFSFGIYPVASGKIIDLILTDSAGNQSFASKKVKTAFEVPELKEATPLSYDEIEVSWQPVPFAEGYCVYRKTKGSNKWTRIVKKEGAKLSSYVDKEVETGETYYYTVKAYDATNESECDETGVFATTELDECFFNDLSSYEEGTATLTWESVEGATGYRIYEQDEYGDWIGIKNVVGKNKTSVTLKGLTSGEIYCYTVRAYRKEDGRTCYSSFDQEGQIVEIK